MSRAAQQQAARVNVDDATWRRFRVLALEHDRSIADYLGQLVRAELGRARRRARAQEPEVATPKDEMGPQVSGAAQVPAVGAIKADEPATRLRLADVDVLTSLPRSRGPARG